MATTVLLVTDSSEMGRIWTYALSQRRLEVLHVRAAGEASDIWSDENVDLVVVDVYSKTRDEIDQCRQLRADSVAPILLLTARGDEAHLLEAYRAGVDECVTKPVSPPLLLAKVRAWLGRSWTVQAEAQEAVWAGNFRLDPVGRELVMPDGGSIRLTNLEFRVIHLLLMHPGRTLGRDFIVDQVWGYGAGDGALVKNVIYRLRQKIEPQSGEPRYLQLVPGEGYTFKTE